MTGDLSALRSTKLSKSTDACVGKTKKHERNRHGIALLPRYTLSTNYRYTYSITYRDTNAFRHLSSYL